MTEKYAQAGVTDIARSENGSQTHTSQSTSQTKEEGSVASVCIPKHRKLSLESRGSSNNEKDSGEDISKGPIQNSSNNHIEIRTLKEPIKDSSNYTGNSGKLHTGRFKLLPKVPAASLCRNYESGDTRMSNQCSSVLEIQTTSDSPARSLVEAGGIASVIDEGHEERSHSISVGKGLESLHSIRTNLCRDSDKKPQSIPQCNILQLDSGRTQNGSLWSHNISHNKANPPKDATARKGYSSSSIRLKKIGPVEAMPLPEPSGYPQNHDDKENLSPYQCSTPHLTEKAAISSLKSAVITESGIRCNGAEKTTVMEAPKVSEAAADAVVVLDSEDSDEENVPVRSKLRLARRCLSRKRKSGF